MSKKPLAIIILAAGKGTRMKSALPKVMHKLAGRPMIQWLLQTAESLSPEKIVVIVGPDMPDLQKAVAPHQAVVQKDRLGTGDAVKTALPALKGFTGDVLVLLGDTPFITAKTLRALIKARGDDLLTGISVLGVQMDDPSGYGRLVADKKGTLEKIVEDKDATRQEKEINIVNTGAFCIDGSRLARWVKKIGNDNAQNEYYITDLPQIAAQDGVQTKICIAPDVTEVRGCNSRADLAALESIVQNRLRDAALAAGVTMYDPSTVYFAYDTKIAADVIVEQNVVFGPGVDVASGAQIKAFSYLEGAKIGADVCIGPFARLRTGTDLAEGSRIGNFVEIKKSSIGKRSKIGHLAYVGDTTMGEDVNFSAGAITVNYDGFEKHETHIGKNVMIGSNVNLVAPVTIDDGAFVAAGSTITEDVPADSLSISRDVTKIREGWAAEYRKRKQALAQKLKRSKKKA